MFLLNFLPEFVIHLIFISGIVITLAGMTLSVVPFIRQYRLPIQLLGAAILLLGVYLEGGLSNQHKWEQKVAEYELKIKDAETRAAETNVQIQEVVVTKTEYVKQRGRDIIQYIDRIKEIPVEVQGPEREKIIEVIKYVENCPLPQLLIDQHNNATKINKELPGEKK